MQKKSIYLILAILLLIGFWTLLSLNKGEAQSQEARWSYQGKTGPEHWGELSDQYKAASEGKRQSPINITGAVDLDLPPLELKSQASQASVENNGHTIEVRLEDSANTLTIKGKTYRLEQFHFHAPGENQINGRSFPFEGHFVYKTKSGEITVVAVLYQYGQENKDLTKIWQKMSQKVNKKYPLSANITVDKLFPKDRDYYNFEGSLTTPPCTEGVNWIVFKKQETISKKQVQQFSKTLGFKNNRPIQKLNGRKIKE